MRPLRAARLLGGSVLAVASGAALAQPMPPIRGEIGVPSLPAVPAPVVPGSPPAGPETVSLTATLAGDPKPIRSGLVWRIYEDKGNGVAPSLIAKLDAPTPTTSLPAGNYVIHAAYGLASASRRVTVGGGARTERFAIEAGGLRLGGAIGDVPIPATRISFSVFQPQPNNPEGRLVAANVRSGDLVRLPVGMFHVTSIYGESNAIMQADLKVDRGRITEAVINHRAATMTLKLVAGAGGEAFAGTAFSVLTPGGDVIREAIGAFPTVTLAEGEYVLIARHNGKVYTRDFRVESGLNGDVEVLVKDT